MMKTVNDNVSTNKVRTARFFFSIPCYTLLLRSWSLDINPPLWRLKFNWIIHSFPISELNKRGIVLYKKNWSATNVSVGKQLLLHRLSVCWSSYVARMGEDRGVQRVLVWKPTEKRPLRRPRSRWEDNIKMDLQEVGGGRGDWRELAQDRDRWRALLGMVRGFRVP